jgi:hypothetical protein
VKESTAVKVDGLKKFFKDKTIFTLDDLREYYRGIDSNFRETTFKWRIHDLKHKGLIGNVKRGVYTFLLRPPYHPTISDRMKNKFKEIKKEFPYSKFCAWETRWLNELVNLQPGNFMILIEVENEAAEAVFYFLQNRSSRDNIYFKPSEKEIEQYIAARQETIIVKTLLTQAPVKEENGICIPRLEKILVDLFVDKSLFIAYQGQELINIFQNAYNQFSINVSTLFRYAHRRKRRGQLKSFLLEYSIVPAELMDP